ncbi:MAG: hypothetical protein WEB53_01450 [Akkermansiaceae bacterium]
MRKLLWLALLLCSAFAMWSWFRPYAWKVDPAARCKIVGVEVKPDQAYFWVTAHLKVTSGEVHDLRKPVLLVTASGIELEPADTTFGGTEKDGTTDIWLKFWLESRQIADALTLRINDGELSVKFNQGVPTGPAYFVTHRW